MPCFKIATRNIVSYKILSIQENVTEQALFMQKLVAETLESNANFGESVSIDDGLMVVGAPGVSAI